MKSTNNGEGDHVAIHVRVGMIICLMVSISTEMRMRNTILVMKPQNILAKRFGRAPFIEVTEAFHNQY